MKRLALLACLTVFVALLSLWQTTQASIVKKVGTDCQSVMKGQERGGVATTDDIVVPAIEITLLTASCGYLIKRAPVFETVFPVVPSPNKVVAMPDIGQMRKIASLSVNSHDAMPVDENPVLMPSFALRC